MIGSCLVLVALGSCLLGGDWPQWGGHQDRNMVSDEKGLPDFFDPGFPKRGGEPDPALWRNVKWVAPLGSWAFGTPAVAGGRVYVGTNNFHPRDPRYRDDRGVLLCLRASDGALLWQLTTPRADYANLGLCAPATVEGDRVYIMSPRSEVLCLDVQGLANGNDGPFTDEAEYYGKPPGRPAPPSTKPVREDPATRPAAAAAGPLGPRAAAGRGTPFTLAPTDADIIWRYDCVKELKVWPHDAASSAVLVYGDYCYVGTSNNIGGVKGRKPNSTVPNFIVLDKRTGQLVARDDAPVARRQFHGQWSSPSLGLVRNSSPSPPRGEGRGEGQTSGIPEALPSPQPSPGKGEGGGRPLIFYGGGDGICYAFDAAPFGPGVGGQKPEGGTPKSPPTAVGGKGPLSTASPPAIRDPVNRGPLGGPQSAILTTVWFCDANPPEYVMRDGKELPYIAKGDGPSEIIGTPTFHQNRVYVSIGQDQLHGPGKGCLTAIDATKTGDVSRSGIVWQYKDLNRSMCTPTVADGLVYLGDRMGVFHCVDAETGQAVWTHRVGGGAIWSSALVADGKVYVGSESGRVWIFAAGREKKVLNSIPLRFPVHTSPVVANGVLYFASSRHLFAVQAPK